jgi:hypothetical protein
MPVTDYMVRQLAEIDQLHGYKVHVCINGCHAFYKETGRPLVKPRDSPPLGSWGPISYLLLSIMGTFPYIILCKPRLVLSSRYAFNNIHKQQSNNDNNNAPEIFLSSMCRIPDSHAYCFLVLSPSSSAFATAGSSTALSTPPTTIDPSQWQQ